MNHCSGLRPDDNYVTGFPLDRKAARTSADPCEAATMDHCSGLRPADNYVTGFPLDRKAASTRRYKQSPRIYANTVSVV